MKRFLKRVRAFAADNWRVGLVVFAGIGIVSTLVLYKLGSLVFGLSESEFALQQQIANNAITPESLLRNPLYLPYFVAMYIIQLSPFHGPTAVRSVGALFGILGAVGFFYILKRWYTLRMAVFGTALFATSSWFLHTARFAAPESSYLLLPMLVAAAICLQTRPSSKTALIIVTVLGLFALYIPGVVWLLLPAAVLQRHVIRHSLRLQPLWLIISLGAFAAIMLVPLVAMVAWPYVQSDVVPHLMALLGLPADFTTPKEIAKNILLTLRRIFLYNEQGPLHTVGRLPLLDVSSALLSILGVIQFVKHFRLDRTKLLIVAGIVGIILIATGGPVSIAFLLPFTYLLIVEGLKWLLSLWLEIFPRNPFARGLAVSLVAALVLVTGFYHLDRYFQAWAFSPETRVVFKNVP